ncbi:hypothetical protein CYMTET_36809, partial [Cymbomonas tetramitiformis]
KNPTAAGDLRAAMMDKATAEDVLASTQSCASERATSLEANLAAARLRVAEQERLAAELQAQLTLARDDQVTTPTTRHARRTGR